MTTNTTFDLAAELGVQLKQRGWQVTCAESCTGGGVAAAITDIPGSSAWFGAGFVTYANAHKMRVLGVSEDSLARVGAVSEEVVREMAAGALREAGADLAVAVSGIAGPDGGTAEKPVGTVWFAWATRQGIAARCHLLAGDRKAVREQAVAVALRGLIEAAKDTV